MINRLSFQNLPIKSMLELEKTSCSIVEHGVQVPEISMVTSESISAVQKCLISLKMKALDIHSDACKFFGVNSPENVMEKLENHARLIYLKCNENEILENFPQRAVLSLERPYTIDNVWNYIWNEQYGRQFEDLFFRPARMTICGQFFGKNGYDGSHTIGILYHPESQTLYCLDSLPNIIKEIKEYQNILKERIFNSPWGEIRKIIFSNKFQQNFNEYTCNNWAIANIEALQKALNEGKIPDSVEELNKILPDDINKILQHQYEYVLKHSIE